MASQRWLEIRVRLGGLPPQPAEDILMKSGALSIEYRDGGDQPILEPGPGETPLWDDLIVCALLDRVPDPSAAIATLRAAIADAYAPDTAPEVAGEPIEDRDWVRAWQQDARAACYGERLWVRPSTAPPTDGDVSIVLDPGLAFGTGSHPTTAMCLDWLARNNCVGRALLDYGCGSGIIAIAGAALGANPVCAIDTDPQAVIATRDNAQRNGLDGSIEVSGPAGLDDELRFDLVIANILCNTLIELAPTLRQACAPGARIALSGILTHQARDVRDAYEPWARLTVTDRRAGWALLSGSVSG